MRKKIVFIVGPTASGKTALSIEIAKAIGGEIISADSMQIYKGIHIASAAPDEEEKRGIKHHLIEFLDTESEFSVADYVVAAREKIEEIFEKGKTPVVVGGTGLYYNSLIDNVQFTDEQTDYSLRAELEEKFDKIGAEKMLEELSQFDPETAARLHPNNRRRIIRAFEVYLQTGITITKQNILSKEKAADFDALVIGVNFRDRQKLYERIEKRVDIMCENGLVDEARKTYSLSKSQKGAFQAIGHKELYSYFSGECSLDEAIENLKMQTRRYAKRQITWFSRDERINWFFVDDEPDFIGKAKDLVSNFLKEG